MRPENAILHATPIIVVAILALIAAVLPVVQPGVAGVAGSGKLGPGDAGKPVLAPADGAPGGGPSQPAASDNCCLDRTAREKLKAFLMQLWDKIFTGKPAGPEKK